MLVGFLLLAFLTDAESKTPPTHPLEKIRVDPLRKNCYHLAVPVSFGIQKG